ncbi:unnamed protein product, partial [Staurois parvus]
MYTDHQSTDDQCALMICVPQQCHLSVSISATSMPIISTYQCPSVHINATYQCLSELHFQHATPQCPSEHLSVSQSVPPISATYQCQSVPPISVHQCRLSVPVS